MTVFIVEKVTDYEYGCRSIEAVFQTYEGAKEYIDNTGMQCEIEFWDGSKAMQYTIGEYEVRIE